MAGRSKLGERFRSVLDTPRGVAGAGGKLAAEVSPEIAAARAANAQLMDDLMALGKDLEGLVNVERTPRKVIFERLGHKIIFSFDHERPRAGISWPGGHEKDNTFFKNDTWHYTFHEPRIRSVPLFDDGLELMLIKGLGLPRPGSNKTVTPLPPTSSGGGSETGATVPGSTIQELEEHW